jgi:hypothetical protein
VAHNLFRFTNVVQKLVDNAAVQYKPEMVFARGKREFVRTCIARHLQCLTNIMLTPIVESCPKGYSSLAVFRDSDESFMVYRRFGFIPSRLLLEKQDKLRELERQLNFLDRREAKADPRRPLIREPKEDHLKPRT